MREKDRFYFILFLIAVCAFLYVHQTSNNHPNDEQDQINAITWKNEFHTRPHEKKKKQTN